MPELSPRQLLTCTSNAPSEFQRVCVCAESRVPQRVCQSEDWKPVGETKPTPRTADLDGLPPNREMLEQGCKLWGS